MSEISRIFQPMILVKGHVQSISLVHFAWISLVSVSWGSSWSSPKGDILQRIHASLTTSIKFNTQFFFPNNTTGCSNLSSVVSWISGVGSAMFSSKRDRVLRCFWSLYRISSWLDPKSTYWIPRNSFSCADVVFQWSTSLFAVLLRFSIWSGFQLDPFEVVYADNNFYSESWLTITTSSHHQKKLKTSQVIELVPLSVYFSKGVNWVSPEKKT